MVKCGASLGFADAVRDKHSASPSGNVTTLQMPWLGESERKTWIPDSGREDRSAHAVAVPPGRGDLVTSKPAREILTAR